MPENISGIWHCLCGSRRLPQQTVPKGFLLFCDRFFLEETDRKQHHLCFITTDQFEFCSCRKRIGSWKQAVDYFCCFACDANCRSVCRIDRKLDQRRKAEVITGDFF